MTNTGISTSTTDSKIIYGWLMLSVLSLVFAGLFAILVAAARVPGLEQLLPLGRDHIYVALVGHVVLAVVIWFLAFQGVLWAVSTTIELGKNTVSPLLGWASLALSYAGMALVVVSAVFGLGAAELANYVPVLLTPLFFIGLILFALGILLALIGVIINLIKARSEGVALPTATFGMAIAGLAVFTSFICFALSGYYQWGTNKAFFDFERLMWGGGHILQFANTVSMVAAWIYLARFVFKKEPLPGAWSKILFIIYALFIIPAPFIFLAYDTSSGEYKDAFTFLMQWGLGPSTVIFIISLITLIAAGKRDWKNPGLSSLALSMAVFLIGGLIALNFSGVNTKIPAHYHCVIGAVTIAFMGLFHEILPTVDKKLYSKKMATIQPYLYTTGILLFAAGLYMAGSHGVARKTYGNAQNLNNTAKVVSMSIMGLGGLVAILGGITFVWNALGTLLGASAAGIEEDAL